MIFDFSLSMNHRRIIIVGCLILLVGILISLRFPQLALLPAAGLAFIVLLIAVIDYPFIALCSILGIRVLLDRYSDIGISLGGFYVNISALLAIAVIGVTPLTIIIKKQLPKSLSATIPLLFFTLLGCVSVGYSLFPLEAFGDALRLCSYAGILILSLIIITPERHSRFLVIFPFIMAVPLLFGLYQLATGTGYYDFGTLKPIGTFFHPNYLGYGSLVALTVVIINIINIIKNRAASYSIESGSRKPQEMTMNMRDKLQATGYGIYGLILLFFIFKVQSLGALFALVLMVGLITARLISKPLIIAGIVGLLLAVTFPLYNYSLRQQGVAIVDNSTFRTIIGESQEDGSFIWRVRNWESMFVYVVQKPLLGWGLGTYKPLRAERVEYDSDLGALEAHNDYMNFVVELGLVGIGILLLALVTLVYMTGLSPFHFSLKNPDTVEPLLVSSLLLATMIAMSVENLFKGASIMWPLLALVGSTITMNVSQRTKKQTG